MTDPESADPGSTDPQFTDPEAYVAVWGLKGMVIPGLFFVVAVFICVVAWRDVVVILLIAVPFFGVAYFWGRGPWRQFRNRTIAFGVDERGVYLGPDLTTSEREWVPWPAVEAIVHFKERDRESSSEGVQTRRYVGIVREGRIVTSRHVSTWKLDPARLAVAAERFGRGTAVRKLPDLDGGGRFRYVDDGRAG